MSDKMSKLYKNYCAHSYRTLKDAHKYILKLKNDIIAAERVGYELAVNQRTMNYKEAKAYEQYRYSQLLIKAQERGETVFNCPPLCEKCGRVHPIDESCK